MTTEQQIAFRKLLSEILMYLCERGRTQDEILTVLDKWENSTGVLVNTVAKQTLPGFSDYHLTPGDRTEFRKAIALALHTIAQPGIKPEIVLQQIVEIENIVNETIERVVRKALGKPQLGFKRLPN